jgi:hypothetical protein
MCEAAGRVSGYHKRGMRVGKLVRLFSVNDVDCVIFNRKCQAVDHVKGMRTEQIRAVDAGSLAESVSRQFRLEPLSLDLDGTAWDRVDDVSDGYGGRKAVVAVHFIVPTKGHYSLWEAGPPGGWPHTIYADVKPMGSEVTFVYELPEPDPAAFRRLFDRDAAHVAEAIAAINPPVAVFNDSLAELVRGEIDERLRLAREDNWAEGLGFPRRKAQGPTQRK